MIRQHKTSMEIQEFCKNLVYTYEYRNTACTAYSIVAWPNLNPNGSYFRFDVDDKITYTYSNNHHKRNG